MRSDHAASTGPTRPAAAAHVRRACGAILDGPPVRATRPSITQRRKHLSEQTKMEYTETDLTGRV
jgi:hypothetical protein